MRKHTLQKGFTLIEIIIATAILAIVGLITAFLVNTAYQQKQQLSSKMSCDQIIDSAFSTLDSFGKRLDPLPFEFKVDRQPDIIPTEPPESFVKNWTPVRLIQKRGDKVLLNNFQLLRSPLTALLAIYNTEGANAVYNGKHNYPETENLVVGALDGLRKQDYQFLIGLRPIDGDGKPLPLLDAQNPFGITPRNKENETHPDLVFHSRDLGMELTIVLEYITTTGDAKSCSGTRSYYYDLDTKMRKIDWEGKFSAFIGDMNVDRLDPKLSQKTMLPIPNLDHEYYACEVKDVSLQVSMESVIIEPGAVVLCQLEIEEDPGNPRTKPKKGNWWDCSKATISGVKFRRFLNDETKSIVYYFRDPTPNITHRLNVMVVDSAGNFQMNGLTFSIDTERPVLAKKIKETTDHIKWFPMPDTSRTAQGEFKRPPWYYQCNDKKASFVAEVQGSLLNKTARAEIIGGSLRGDQICDFSSDPGVIEEDKPENVLVVPIGIDGEIFKSYECSINSFTPVTNGIRTVNLRTGDLCGKTEKAISSFTYGTVSKSPKIANFTPLPGSSSPGDEKFQILVEGGLKDRFIVYCPCTDTGLRAPPFECEVGGTLDGCERDPKGETKAVVYDICSTRKEAEASPSRSQKANYCFGNLIYSRTACESRFGAGNCFDVGNSNCWQGR